MQYVTISPESVHDIRYRVISALITVVMAIVMLIPTLFYLVAGTYLDIMDKVLDWVDTTTTCVLGKVCTFFGVKGIEFHD